jgi:hypothetical protein
MPILPLMDLMIFLAWSSLIVAFIEKGLELALASRAYHLFGMSPFDWTVVSGVSLLFAISLAARAWVKTLEGRPNLRISKTGVEELPDFPDPRVSPNVAAMSVPPPEPPTRVAAR